MSEWKHELSREQYELLIDGLLRGITIATVIQESAEHLDAAALKEMAGAMKDRIAECLSFGQFDEDDIETIHRDVMSSMYTRPDA